MPTLVDRDLRGFLGPHNVEEVAEVAEAEVPMSVLELEAQRVVVPVIFWARKVEVLLPLVRDDTSDCVLRVRLFWRSLQQIIYNSGRHSVEALYDSAHGCYDLQTFRSRLSNEGILDNDK